MPNEPLTLAQIEAKPCFTCPEGADPLKHTGLLLSKCDDCGLWVCTDCGRPRRQHQPIPKGTRMNTTPEQEVQALSGNEQERIEAAMESSTGFSTLERRALFTIRLLQSQLAAAQQREAGLREAPGKGWSAFLSLLLDECEDNPELLGDLRPLLTKLRTALEAE